MFFFHEQSGFIRNYRMGALITCTVHSAMQNDYKEKFRTALWWDASYIW